MSILELPGRDMHIIYCSAYDEDYACMPHEYALKIE